MTSALNQDRNFIADQPVFVTSQYTQQHDLTKSRALKEAAAQLFYKVAKAKQVEVYAFHFLDNHSHAIVSQRFSDHDDDCRLGIAPLMRDFQGALSVLCRVLKIEGCKYIRRYHSVNLATVEDFINKMGYTLAQAINHGFDPAETLCSDELLSGDINPAIRRLPKIYRGRRRDSRREMTGRLAAVIQAAIANYQTLIDGGSLDREKRFPQQVKRSRKQRAARHRKASAHAARQERRMRRTDDNHTLWREAAQVALYEAGIDGDRPMVQLSYFSTEPLDPQRWALETKRIEQWRVPAMETEQVYDERGRVCGITLRAAGYPDATTHWSHRTGRFD